MTFTVARLLGRADLATRSLTPGVGEDRRIDWAHVCELAEPWVWIGDAALIMTTGLAVPRDPDEQCAYLAGMHRAGIAAVTIGERMSAPPLSPQMLAYAAELDFPVLETAHATPFIVLAKGVADEVSRADRRRVRTTERLYEALRQHASDASADGLLETLAQLLDATVTLGTAEDDAPQDRILRIGPRTYTVPLLAPGAPRLVVEHRDDVPPDHSLLHHAGAVVGSVLAVRAAARRRESLNGALLFGDLLDGSLATASASRLLQRQGVEPPFAVAVWRGRGDADEVEKARAALESCGEQALVTARDGLVLVLAGGASETLPESLATAAARRLVGVSRTFADLSTLPDAHHQARIALTRGDAASGVVHFEQTRPASLFLPVDGEQLRDAAVRTLGPIIDYDCARGTELLPTLRVFLAENRSWVRAAERLFIHRQTLVSRVARIEQLTGRSLNTMEGSAELWFAVQAAVESGLLRDAV